MKAIRRVGTWVVALACSGAMGCKWLHDLDSSLAQESKQQDEAAAVVYAKLAAIQKSDDAAAAAGSAKRCSPQAVAGLAREKVRVLTLDYPLLAYGMSEKALDVSDPNDARKSDELDWWKFMRSPELAALRPRSAFHDSFDAVAAQKAMGSHGLLAVLRPISFSRPKPAEGGRFVPGEYRGVILLHRTEGGEVLCAHELTASSSDAQMVVKGVVGAMAGGEAEQLDRDFQSNVQSATERALATVREQIGAPAEEKR